DQETNGPTLVLTINRDTASRFGIQPALIDATLADAFGQLQVAQFFTQVNTYKVILEVTPNLQGSLDTLSKLYVKSPTTVQAIPLPTLVSVDTTKVEPLTFNHQGSFPAVTLSFNLAPGASLGAAVNAITAARTRIGLPSTVTGSFQGNAQEFQKSLASEPF